MAMPSCLREICAGSVSAGIADITHGTKGTKLVV